MVSSRQKNIGCHECHLRRFFSKSSTSQKIGITHCSLNKPWNKKIWQWCSRSSTITRHLISQTSLNKLLRNLERAHNLNKRLWVKNGIDCKTTLVTRNKRDWNSIPLQTRNCGSLEVFQNYIRTNILEKMPCNKFRLEMMNVDLRRRSKLNEKKTKDALFYANLNKQLGESLRYDQMIICCMRTFVTIS